MILTWFHLLSSTSMMTNLTRTRLISVETTLKSSMHTADLTTI